MPNSRYYGQLLDLYSAAAQGNIADFEQRALRQLGVLVGFDGAIWGEGACSDISNSLSITHAQVVDRPSSLIADYGAISSSDPVTRQFIASPTTLQNVNTKARYASEALASHRDYCERYKISHLLLKGFPDYQAYKCTWIVAYREDKDKPYSTDDEKRFLDLVPHWGLALSIARRMSQQNTKNVGSSVPTLLTPRQQETLSLLALGLSYREISRQMGISLDTVKEHASNIYIKLGVQNRSEAIFEGRVSGLIK